MKDLKYCIVNTNDSHDPIVYGLFNTSEEAHDSIVELSGKWTADGTIDHSDEFHVTNVFTDLV
jgi:hypothetical protein